MIPALPTPRLIRLIAIGAPLWLLWAAAPVGWLAPVGYLALLAPLALRDWLAAPRAADFEARRELPKRFGFDTEQTIGLVLVNRSRRHGRIALVDDAPAAFDQHEALPDAEMGPGEALSWRYAVRPGERGLHRFGALHCRAAGPWGLVARAFRLPAETEVRVYPRFLGVDRYDLLARISEREEAVRMPRLARGEGHDFESLRPYLPGEDPRRIDWKTSAKRGTLISRNLQVERGQQVAVLIDAGRLMKEKIGPYPRLEHAMNAAVMLSYVAQKRGDSVALASFSNRLESFMPPIKGAAVMANALEALCRVQARDAASDYWNVVAHLMSRLKKRSLIVMLTDVLDPAGAAGLTANLARAARKHLVLCVAFVEKAVYRMAESAPADLDGAYHKAAAAHFSLQRRLALEAMRRCGIHILETPPERMSVQLVRRYLELRKADLQ